MLQALGGLPGQHFTMTGPFGYLDFIAVGAVFKGSLYFLSHLQGPALAGCGIHYKYMMQKYHPLLVYYLYLNIIA